MRQPRSIASGLVLVLAGLLSGYLLWKAYYTRALLTPEGAAFVITQVNSALVAAFGSVEASSRALWVMDRLILAMPGALLFGIPIGIALRRVAHRRLLLYPVLAWPLGTYAYATFVIRVIRSLPEQEQVALWHFRGVAAVDSLFIYSPFFVIVYFAFLLLRAGPRRLQVDDGESEQAARRAAAS